MIILPVGYQRLASGSALNDFGRLSSTVDGGISFLSVFVHAGYAAGVHMSIFPWLSAARGNQLCSLIHYSYMNISEPVSYGVLRFLQLDELR